MYEGCQLYCHCVIDFRLGVICKDCQLQAFDWIYPAAFCPDEVTAHLVMTLCDLLCFIDNSPQNGCGHSDKGCAIWQKVGATLQHYMQ